MKIRPLADRVVIKNVEAEETTKSGIILPVGDSVVSVKPLTRN
jgi:co-chaperonin GroES (HSP10)